MSTFDELKQLISNFYRDVALAKELESPNPEDDLAIRTAIVGFSYHSPAQAWDKGHYDFVKLRLYSDYGSDELAKYGENGENVKLFFALGIGYLLGLFQQGQLGEADFEQAERQLPGVIMYYLQQLTERAC